MAHKVGDKVRFNYDDTIGEVLEVRDDNVETGTKYLIKWEGSRCAPDWEHEELLTLYDPEVDARLGAAVQVKIDEATSALEKAYKAYAAAKELTYQQSSMSYLIDKSLINLDKFGAVAANFGWTSSSLYCS